MAAPDPSTLAAAFSDHAQRTDGGWRFSRRRRPLGNGMPIRNAAGAMDSAVISIFAGKGQETAPAVMAGAANASSATRIATPASTCINLASLSAITLRLQKLPAPLATS